MKKIIRLVFLCMMMSAIIVGCGKGPKDDYAAYRNMTAEELFTTAERQLARGHYSDAAKRFEAMDAIYPFGPYAEQSDLDIIYAYFQSDDQPSAVAAADRYIRLYPESEHVDYAYYMKGLVSYNIGLSWIQRQAHLDPTLRDLSEKKTAFLAFQQLVMMFPNSIYAPDALYRMAVIRNMAARKEITIAQFYLNKKAYLAAANRASDVVAHYNGSPAVIPALAIMIKAYRALGLVDLEQETIAVFEASYPNAPELHQALQTPPPPRRPVVPPPVVPPPPAS